MSNHGNKQYNDARKFVIGLFIVPFIFAAVLALNVGVQADSQPVTQINPPVDCGIQLEAISSYIFNAATGSNNESQSEPGIVQNSCFEQKFQNCVPATVTYDFSTRNTDGTDVKIELITLNSVTKGCLTTWQFTHMSANRSLENIPMTCAFDNSQSSLIALKDQIVNAYSDCNGPLVKLLVSNSNSAAQLSGVLAQTDGLTPPPTSLPNIPPPVPQVSSTVSSAPVLPNTGTRGLFIIFFLTSTIGIFVYRWYIVRQHSLLN